MRKTDKRHETSNLEATGSTPVGRANKLSQMLVFQASPEALPKTANGTIRQQVAQSGTKMTQKMAHSFEECSPNDSAQILAELTRMKCVFQLRTICAVMDLPQERITP